MGSRRYLRGEGRMRIGKRKKRIEGIEAKWRYEREEKEKFKCFKRNKE